jgi:DNA repair exonuclease SbcCD ATPase subunit
VTSESESSDGRPPSASGEASHDSLGDTQLGRSLKALIQEIGKEKEALQQGFASGNAPGSGSQAGDDFDPSQTRFDQALELAASAPQESGSSGAGSKSAQSPGSALPTASPTADPTRADADPEISQAMAGIATVLQRFAEAERRRSEEQIAEWKVQLKKATMIVIKKQVDTARAKWMQNMSANETKIAEHYRRLKALADKVAKQKAQIQSAKKELEQKLEVADRLHSEFDEIRHVLDGQIGAINALEDNEDPADS